MERKPLESEAWRGEPATQAQIDYLLSIGITPGKGITKGRAHEIIEGPATRDQLRRLKYYGIPTPKNLGRREATELIGAYLAHHPEGERHYDRYETYNHSMGCLLRLLVLCAIVLGASMAYNRWLKQQDTPVSQAPVSTPIPAPALPAISPPPKPAAPTAQDRAIALYPTLARAGSPLNLKFLELVQQHQHTDPDIFKDPEWPTEIAREADQDLNAVSSPGSTPPQ